MNKKKVSAAVFYVLLVSVSFALGYLFGQGNGVTAVQMTTVPVMMETVGEEEPASQPERTGPIDLNTATQEELEQLPGIGPSIAARIIAYREENEFFSSTEELLNVEGIGEKRYQDIKDLVSIGG